MFALLLSVFAILASGCKTTDIVYKTEVQYIVVKPSNALLEECTPIQSKEIKTNGDLANAYTGLMFDYLVCSNKLKILKAFYKEYESDNKNNLSSKINSMSSSSLSE